MKLKFNKWAVSAVMIGAMIMGFASTARAILIDLGDPREGNSWYMTFGYFGAVDSLKAVMVPAPTLSTQPSFESPGFINLSQSSWQATSSSLGVIQAAGSSVNYLEFTIAFNNDMQTPLTFTLEALNGGSVDKHTAIWSGTSGGSWDIHSDGNFVGSVPDGGTTLLLLGLSMLGLTALRRKLS